MKTQPIHFRIVRGSALITTIFLIAIMAILTASILGYSASEERGNQRNRLILRAKNMAENISIYSAEQLTTKLYRLGSVPVMVFPWTGTSLNRVYLPPDSVLTTSYITPASCEMRAGIMSSDSNYTLVTDTSDPNYGLQVRTAMVPIIAKATATTTALGSVSAYVEQDMEMALTPLFQFGMFYNMDMELYPSGAFTISGPVNTNDRLLAHPQGTTTTAITFQGRVTVAGDLFADYSLKAVPRSATGAELLPTLADGDVSFTSTAGVVTSLKNSSNLWRDHKYLTTAETSTTLAQFKTFATNTYTGNLRTSVHGVTPLQLPGIGTYEEQDDPSTTDVDERSNGRQIIAVPNGDKWVWNSSTSTGSWQTNTDDSNTVPTMLAYKAGLFIIVNPDNEIRTGHLPDGTTQSILPRSYRSWLNTYDTVAGTHTVREVVLPGQPSYGYNNGADATAGTADDYMYENTLPNRYTISSVAGDSQTGNQVVRIPQQGYGLATGYTVGTAAAIGTTSLALTGGSNTILPGETVVVYTGASPAATDYRYLVTAALSSNVLTISSPGLRVAAAVGAKVAIDAASRTIGTASGYKLSILSAQSAQALSINTGTGTILPGNTLTIGSNKYLVAASTASSSLTTVWIASPGLIPVGGFILGTAVTLDTTSGNLGTGTGYLINNSSGYLASYVTSTVGGTLALDTGTGTILPGDMLYIGSTQYMVSATPSPSATITSLWIAAPTLGVAIADNTPAFVDPFRKSGYDTSTSPAFAADSSSGTTLNPGGYYFYDMRRANGNRGVIAMSGTTALYDRYDVPYVPRPIAKIDFDYARLRMMVDRTLNVSTTSTTYDLRNPSGSGSTQATWANSIYNYSATQAAEPLGMGGTTFTTFPAGAGSTAQDPFKLYYAPTGALASGADPTSYVVPAVGLYDASNPSPWYQGIAIYIESVDAEKRAQTTTNGLGTPVRIDSGVRLWNARGPVTSITTNGLTGCTMVTNDAAYIIGDFNADGVVTSSTASTGNGGYSAQWPDSANEYLCSVMADAITIVSQPEWSSASSGQVDGWNDAVSALPCTATSSGWRTGANASATLAGNYDGVYVTSGTKPGLFPNDSNSGTLGATSTVLLPMAHDTEVSTAMVVGIVPSNHNPTQLTDGYVPTFSLPASGSPAQVGDGVNSGGANNFPRLLQSWTGHNLYIRGSMVALFESRVAMEPFTNSRCYGAPGRYWGLHNGFSTQNHHVPLEPIVLSATRVGFRELSASDYATMKTTIEGLH